MEFIDLAFQQNRIKPVLEKNIRKVLDHGQYIMGPEIKELEERLSAFIQNKYAIACSSGTDALLLSLLAYGVGQGDAIFTTPFTFIATAEVIGLIGATPIFVDIDPKTYNIDPDKLETAILALNSNDSTKYPLPSPNISSTLKPKGIVTVDLFGLPADYDRIRKISVAHNLFLIEDGAQSFGGEYKGNKSCSFGDISCTSFFPAKPLGCYGDGGMCFTDNDQLATILRSLLVHGKGTHKYDNARIGINGRLDTIQAAILLSKFDIFPEEIHLRNRVADNYSYLLSAFSNLSIPHVPNGYKSIWAQYSVLAKNEEKRALMQSKLKENGIPTAIYYPKPLHLQSAFSFLGYSEGDFSISELYSKTIFSLPMHPYIDIEDQKKIAEIINTVN